MWPHYPFVFRSLPCRPRVSQPTDALAPLPSPPRAVASPASQIATSSTSYLTLLEQTTSLLITALLSHQSLSPLSAPTTLPLSTTPPCKVTIQLAKPVTLASCQRLKRQFTKMNMQMKREFDPATVARLFAEYLEGAVN